MVTEDEYEQALLSIRDPFEKIKAVLENRLMAKCINAKEHEEVLAIQAQYKLLSQIETEIQNVKDGEQ